MDDLRPRELGIFGLLDRFIQGLDSGHMFWSKISVWRPGLLQELVDHLGPRFLRLPGPLSFPTLSMLSVFSCPTLSQPRPVAAVLLVLVEHVA
eukprot:4157388-Pyramimonas_sp.AAC.1